VLGKSGSGKSTLLSVISGMDSVTSGEVRVGGRLLGVEVDYDLYRNELIGFVFQEINLNNSLNVRQNVLFSDRIKNASLDVQKADAVLSRVGLKSKAGRRVNRLSGGERQRVAIARALIKNPDIIFADEPTGKLDEVNGAAVLNTLKELSAEKLVIVVSHDRASAEKYADRIVEIEDGEIVADNMKNPAYKESAADKTRNPAYTAPYSHEESADGKTAPYVSKKTVADDELAALNADPARRVAVNRTERFIPYIQPETAENDDNIINYDRTNLDLGLYEKLNVGQKQYLAAYKARRMQDPQRRTTVRALHLAGKRAPRLKARSVAFLAFRSLFSHKIKTAGMIAVSAILLAVIGIGTVILSFNEAEAGARTYIKNKEVELVMYKGIRGEMDYSDIGADIIDYMKKNYGDSYLEIRRLNGFSLPQYLGGGSADVGNGIPGVYEIDETDLAKLGYSLADYGDVENLLYSLRYSLEDIIEELRIAYGLPRPSDVEIPGEIWEYLGDFSGIPGLSDAKTVGELLKLLEEYDWSNTEISDYIGKSGILDGFPEIGGIGDLFELLTWLRDTDFSKLRYLELVKGIPGIKDVPGVQEAETLYDLALALIRADVSDIRLVDWIKKLPIIKDIPGIEGVETVSEILKIITSILIPGGGGAEWLLNIPDIDSIPGIAELKALYELLTWLETADSLDISRIIKWICDNVPCMADLDGFKDITTVRELINWLETADISGTEAFEYFKELPVIRDIPGIDGVETVFDLIELLRDYGWDGKVILDWIKSTPIVKVIPGIAGVDDLEELIALLLSEDLWALLDIDLQYLLDYYAGADQTTIKIIADIVGWLTNDGWLDVDITPVIEFICGYARELAADEFSLITTVSELKTWLDGGGWEDIDVSRLIAFLCENIRGLADTDGFAYIATAAELADWIKNADLSDTEFLRTVLGAASIRDIPGADVVKTLQDLAELLVSYKWTDGELTALLKELPLIGAISGIPESAYLYEMYFILRELCARDIHFWDLIDLIEFIVSQEEHLKDLPGYHLIEGIYNRIKYFKELIIKYNDRILKFAEDLGFGKLPGFYDVRDIAEFVEWLASIDWKELQFPSWLRELMIDAGVPFADEFYTYYDIYAVICREIGGLDALKTPDEWRAFLARIAPYVENPYLIIAGLVTKLIDGNEGWEKYPLPESVKNIPGVKDLPNLPESPTWEDFGRSLLQWIIAEEESISEALKSSVPFIEKLGIEVSWAEFSEFFIKYLPEAARSLGGIVTDLYDWDGWDEIYAFLLEHPDFASADTVGEAIDAVLSDGIIEEVLKMLSDALDEEIARIDFTGVAQWLAEIVYRITGIYMPYEIFLILGGSAYGLWRGLKTVPGYDDLKTLGDYFAFINKENILAIDLEAAGFWDLDFPILNWGILPYISGHYKYVGAGNGDYGEHLSYYFNQVGAGNGSYIYNSEAAYSYVGDSNGDYVRTATPYYYNVSQGYGDYKGEYLYAGAGNGSYLGVETSDYRAVGRGYGDYELRGSYYEYVGDGNGYMFRRDSYNYIYVGSGIGDFRYAPGYVYVGNRRGSYVYGAKGYVNVGEGNGDYEYTMYQYAGDGGGTYVRTLSHSHYVNVGIGNGDYVYDHYEYVGEGRGRYRIISSREYRHADGCGDYNYEIVYAGEGNGNYRYRDYSYVFVGSGNGDYFYTQNSHEYLGEGQGDCDITDYVFYEWGYGDKDYIYVYTVPAREIYDWLCEHVDGFTDASTVGEVLALVTDVDTVEGLKWEADFGVKIAEVEFFKLLPGIENVVTVGDLYRLLRERYDEVEELNLSWALGTAPTAEQIYGFLEKLFTGDTADFHGVPLPEIGDEAWQKIQEYADSAYITAALLLWAFTHSEEIYLLNGDDVDSLIEEFLYGLTNGINVGVHALIISFLEAGFAGAFGEDGLINADLEAYVDVFGHWLEDNYPEQWEILKNGSLAEFPLFSLQIDDLYVFVSRWRADEALRLLKWLFGDIKTGGGYLEAEKDALYALIDKIRDGVYTEETINYILKYFGIADDVPDEVKDFAVYLINKMLKTGRFPTRSEFVEYITDFIMTYTGGGSEIKEIITYIVDYILTNGCIPSVEKIAEAVADAYGVEAYNLAFKSGLDWLFAYLRDNGRLPSADEIIDFAVREGVFYYFGESMPILEDTLKYIIYYFVENCRFPSTDEVADFLVEYFISMLGEVPYARELLGFVIGFTLENGRLPNSDELIAYLRSLFGEDWRHIAEVLWEYIRKYVPGLPEQPDLTEIIGYLWEQMFGETVPYAYLEWLEKIISYIEGLESVPSIREIVDVIVEAYFGEAIPGIGAFAEYLIDYIITHGALPSRGELVDWITEYVYALMGDDGSFPYLKDIIRFIVDYVLTTGRAPTEEEILEYLISLYGGQGEATPDVLIEYILEIIKEIIGTEGIPPYSEIIGYIIKVFLGADILPVPDDIVAYINAYIEYQGVKNGDSQENIRGLQTKFINFLVEYAAENGKKPTPYQVVDYVLNVLLTGAYAVTRRELLRYTIEHEYGEGFDGEGAVVSLLESAAAYLFGSVSEKPSVNEVLLIISVGFRLRSDVNWDASPALLKRIFEVFPTVAVYVEKNPWMLDIRSIDDLLSVLRALENPLALTPEEVKRLPYVRLVPGMENVDIWEDIAVLLLDYDEMVNDVPLLRTLKDLQTTLGIKDGKTFARVLEYIQNADMTISLDSRFPITGLPVVYDGGKALSEVVVTDFFLYIIMCRLASNAGDRLGIRIPTDDAEFAAFLNSGYEAVLVAYFNAVNEIAGFADIRITGVIDTGFKTKYFGMLRDIESLSWSGSVEASKLAYDLQNYYMMFYSADGFARNSYAGVAELDTEATALPGVIGIRIAVPESEAARVFAYMEKHDLMSSTLYARVIYQAGPNIDRLRAIFLPVTILMGIIALLALAVFITASVLGKKKEIGVIKALGMRSSDIARIFIAESLIIIIAVIIAACAITVGLYYGADFLLKRDLTRFVSPELVNRIVLLYLTYLPFVLMGASALVVGLLSVIYPVRKIAKLTPLTSIRDDT
jgi:ABC-type lipoprotein export system ATPase subunit